METHRRTAGLNNTEKDNFDSKAQKGLCGAQNHTGTKDIARYGYSSLFL